MHRGDLTNAEWERVAPLLPSAGRRPGRETDDRTLINGMLYQARTGLRWRDLPSRFGCWVTIYRRHRHWAATGTWQRVVIELQTGEENSNRILGNHLAGRGLARRTRFGSRTGPEPYTPDLRDITVLDGLYLLLGDTFKPRTF